MKLKKLTTSLLLSAIAYPAFCADTGPLPPSSDQGFYAGGTLGPSKTSSNIGATVLSKTSGFVLGGLGGYQFNKNLSVEAQFTGAGNFESAPVTGKNDALSLVGVGFIPLGNDVSIYGKLGFAKTRTSLSSNTLPSNGADRSSATYGIGVQYNFARSIGIRLGWDRFGSAIVDKGGNTQKFDSGILTVGAIYKF